VPREWQRNRRARGSPTDQRTLAPWLVFFRLKAEATIVESRIPSPDVSTLALAGTLAPAGTVAPWHAGTLAPWHPGTLIRAFVFPARVT
jgi:hypothetical protein